MEKSFDERVADAKAAVSAVSPQEANKRKSVDPNTLFIDPRDIPDINATTGIIPGALSISLSLLSDCPQDELPAELHSHSRPIIASCQGGPMGALAAHALKQRGYKNVVFIEGGTQGWLDAGYSTSR